MTTLQYRVASPVQAVETLDTLFVGAIEPRTRRGGAGVLTWQTDSEYLREKHRGMFHGPICKAFAEQVWLWDPKLGRCRPFERAVWKDYLKQRFLTPRVQEYVTRHGEVKYRQLPLSTEALSNDEYSDFLHECLALGHELGVDFGEEGN